MKDHIEGTMLLEDYFKTSEHPEEFQINMEAVKWVHNNILDFYNIIKFKGKIIGSVFMLPCNKDLMTKFLTNKINENQLMEGIKKDFHPTDFECIYLCSSFIKPEYRGKGLSVEARIKTIKKVIGKRKVKPILFYEPYTKEGEMSCRKVAEKLGFKLLKK